jgi:hypothetical protein
LCQSIGDDPPLLKLMRTTGDTAVPINATKTELLDHEGLVSTGDGGGCADFMLATNGPKGRERFSSGLLRFA